MRKLKPYLPLLLSVLFLAGSACRLYFQARSFEYVPPSEDMVSRWDQRMKPVRETLPSDVFEAGYLEKGNIPGSDAAFDDAEFYMTQYALAPVVLMPGFTRPWVIGNFGRSTKLKDIEPWIKEELGKCEIQIWASVFI